jgi:Domain of unknown function (DUF4166)
MKSLMQQALGDAWDQLPPALQSHYLPGKTLDVGHLDVEYPAYMQPALFVLSRLGALVRRRGKAVQTSVGKSVVDKRLHWHRTLRYSDGQTLHFNSVWELGPNGHVVEFVNSWLGLQMHPYVVGRQLHYRGVRFVARVGHWVLHIPEWLLLGHTTIEERALDDHHFAMDFRIVHPVLGQLFRYSGTFRANAVSSSSSHQAQSQ